MKLNRLSLLCLFVIALFPLNSCSDDEPDAPQYVDYEFAVEVLDGYSLIYDVTCTFTNVCTNEVEHKNVGNLGESLFTGKNQGVKAKEVVLKVEGKLKPNAKELVEEAIAKNRTFSIGHKCRGKGLAYYDAGYTKYGKEVFSFHDSSELNDFAADRLMYYVENYPTNVFCEIHTPVK